MLSLKDITIIFAAVAQISAFGAIISGSIRLLAANMLSGSTSFLLMNIADSERIKRNSKRIKTLQVNQKQIIEEICDD